METLDAVWDESFILQKQNNKLRLFFLLLSTGYNFHPSEFWLGLAFLEKLWFLQWFPLSCQGSVFGTGGFLPDSQPLLQIGSFVNLNDHPEIRLVLSWPIRFHFFSHWGLIPNVCKEYLLISKGGGCSNTWIESTWKWVAGDIVLVSKPASYVVPAHLKASEYIRAWKCYWGKLIEIGPHKKNEHRVYTWVN